VTRASLAMAALLLGHAVSSPGASPPGSRQGAEGAVRKAGTRHPALDLVSAIGIGFSPHRQAWDTVGMTLRAERTIEAQLDERLDDLKSRLLDASLQAEKLEKELRSRTSPSTREQLNEALRRTNRRIERLKRELTRLTASTRCIYRR
jgi:uncharacterized membrane protein YccC